MTGDRNGTEGQGITPGLRAVPPQLETLAPATVIGGSTSRHLFIDPDDKLLVMVDPVTRMEAVERMRSDLATMLGVDRERIAVLVGGRDIMTVTVDDGGDEAADPADQLPEVAHG